MAYTPTVWKNGEFPPIDAEHLNKIEQGIADAVSVTPQSLTGDQKSQARDNIGAAPDGFGLGGSARLLTSADNLDTLMKNGWYYYSTSNAPQGALPSALAPYATLIHVSAAGNTCVQEAYDPSDSNQHGTVLRRTVYGIGSGAKIYPWEWVNPPLNGDKYTMYRTVERLRAQPVYRGSLQYYQVWKPDSEVWPYSTDWGSEGKALMVRVDKGATVNVPLISDRTFIISWTDNIRQGAVIVQTASSRVAAITNLVPPSSWKIEIGTGLSVNITETQGDWAGDASIFMV